MLEPLKEKRQKPFFVADPQAKLQRIIKTGILAAIAAYFLIQFLLLSFQYLRYPYEIDYGEGCGLTFLTHLKTYGTYFFDINDYPFSYATYPPVFMLITWAVNLVVPSGLMAARLVSIAATCLLILVLYLLLWNRTKDRLLSLLSALSFLGIWFVRLWAPLGRIDMVVCLFTLTGLFCFQVYQGSRKRYWAFFFFVLAFFTKQNAVLAPAAVLLYALIRKEQRKYFFSYLAAYLIPIVVLFSLLNLYTHGEAFKHLFLLTAQRSISLEGTYINLTSFLVFMWLPLILCFLGIYKGKKTNESLLYLIYLVLCLASTPASTVGGANMNYFIEPALGLILFSAVVCRGALDRIQEGKKRSWRRWMLVILVATYGIVSYRFSDSILGERWADFTKGPYYQNEEEVMDHLSRWIKETRGDILSSNLTLLAVNQKPIILGDLPPAAYEGKWHPEKLIEDCQKKRFQLIIAHWRGFLDAAKLTPCVEKKYRVKQILPTPSAVFMVFKPK